VQAFRRAFRPNRLLLPDRPKIICSPLNMTDVLDLLLAISDDVELEMSNGKTTRSVTKFMRDIQQSERALWRSQFGSSTVQTP
jgi:hypothetical protein